jgi:hypothetical protein
MDGDTALANIGRGGVEALHRLTQDNLGSMQAGPSYQGLG